MMKYLRVGLPVVIVLACVLSFFNAMNSNNSLAMAGYVTAFFGWLAIAFDAWLDYRARASNNV